MSAKKDIGLYGEKLAKRHLTAQNYRLLESNWRYRRAEIDIIAMDGDILVFVEVKTRSTAIFGQPESFVSARKQKLYFDAASVYMESIGHDWEIRFDIISVVIAHPKDTITHFKDAFF